MAKVELKQPIVDEISGVINGAQSVVVVDYLGLTVAEDTQLRKQLREAGVTYKVYKNTLVNRAIQGTEFEGLKDVLEGPSAFAVSTEDATAPARILAKFAKTAPALEIKAGVVEGTFYDAEGMKAIAAVPSRDELLGKLLGSIQSPITNLARVLNQIAEQGGEAAPAEAAEETKTEDAAEAGKEEEKPNVYTVGPIVLDEEKKSVTVDGDEVALTPIEFNILRLLMKNPGRIYSSAQIYELVWKEDSLGAETSVSVHIRHLRQKLEINPSEPRYLKVVWGLGYKMEDKK